MFSGRLSQTHVRVQAQQPPDYACPFSVQALKAEITCLHTKFEPLSAPEPLQKVRTFVRYQNPKRTPGNLKTQKLLPEPRQGQALFMFWLSVYLHFVHFLVLFFSYFNVCIDYGRLKVTFFVSDHLQKQRSAKLVSLQPITI